MVNLGIVAIARLSFQVFDPRHAPVLGVLMVLGVVSALVGAVLALAQDDLKRLLAYDTVSQMGVLAIGLATGTAAGVSGATYHLFNHALFKSLLFLCAGAIVHGTGLTDLSKMGGLARHRPVVAGAFTLGVLSIVGVPPFNGYVSLSLIHSGLEESHQLVVLALMLLAQLITIAALGKAAWLAFYRPREQEYDDIERLSPGMLTAFLTLGGCCIVFGVLPELFLSRIMEPAAEGLLSAGSYARAVLSGSGRLPQQIHVPFHYL
jgi:multicomponent Na+:H+ antiporter subunit D